MAEYTVSAKLDGRIDVEINMNKLTPKEMFELLKAMRKGKIYTFHEVYVELEGETEVTIEHD